MALTARDYYNVGNTLHDQNKLGEAVTAYKKSIQLNPDYAIVYNNLGVTLKKQNKLGEAVIAFKKVIELEPDDDAYYRLGNVLSDLKKLGEAVIAYSKAIKLNPDHADAYCNLGYALHAQNKLGEAVTAYKKAIKLNPDHANAYNNLGNVLKAQNKLGEAVTAYKKVIELNPDYANAYCNLGNVLKAQNKLGEAVIAFNKAIKLNPDHAKAYYNLGRALDDLEKYDEAVIAYKKAIKLDPDFADAYCNLGNTLDNLEKYDEAVVACKKAIELEPDDAYAYNGLGLILQAQNKLDEAVTAYEKAVELEPDRTTAYYNLGSVLDDLKNHDEAVIAFKKAIKLDPDYADAYHALGITLKKQNKLGEAVIAFNKAIELKPEPLCFCNLGKFLKGQGKNKEALECFNKAYELTSKGEFGNGVSAGNKDYIQSTLDEDRKELLETVIDISKVEIKDDKVLEAKRDGLVSKVLDSLNHPKTNSAATKQEESDLSKELAKLKAELEANFHAQITEMKQEQAVRDEEQDVFTKHNADNIKEIKEVLIVAGVYDAAQIKAGFKDLESKPELHDYAKVFYWTLLNYFIAYRSLGTGLVKNNIEDSMVESAGKKVKDCAVEVIKAVPIIGSVIEMIDKAVTSIYDARREHKFENKVKIINEIMTHNKDTILDQDISLRIANTALLLSKAREDIILQQEDHPHKINHMAEAKSWLSKKISDVKKKVLDAADVYNNHATTLAIEDVVKLLACMYENHEKIIRNTRPLDEQFSIFLTGGVGDQLIKDAAEASEDAIEEKSSDEDLNIKAWLQVDNLSQSYDEDEVSSMGTTESDDDCCVIL